AAAAGSARGRARTPRSAETFRPSRRAVAAVTRAGRGRRAPGRFRARSPSRPRAPTRSSTRARRARCRSSGRPCRRRRHRRWQAGRASSNSYVQVFQRGRELPARAPGTSPASKGTQPRAPLGHPGLSTYPGVPAMIRRTLTMTVIASALAVPAVGMAADAAKDTHARSEQRAGVTPVSTAGATTRDDARRFSDRDWQKNWAADKDKMEQALGVGKDKAHYRKALEQMGFHIT